MNRRQVLTALPLSVVAASLLACGMGGDDDEDEDDENGGNGDEDEDD